MIDGQTWRAWSDLEIKLALDGFSTIGFTAPFEPERDAFRETFRPFTYRSLEVLVDGTRLFAGTMIDVSPSVTESARAVGISGYALPAVLGDTSPPASSFPLEFNGLTLRQIAQRVVEPFGLEVEVEGDDGATFRRVALEPGGSPLSFLADLAKQRGMVVSSSPNGALRFLRSAPVGHPVARLVEGVPPLGAVSASFSPQAYFSEVTGLASARAGSKGSSYTGQNTKLTGVMRPSSFTLGDTDSPDLPSAVNAKLGRMFGNAATYSISLPTWRDPSGALWRPNTTLTLNAPGAMIYRETEMLIRAVSLKFGDSITAALDLVLPGAFSGEIPSVLPWE